MSADFTLLWILLLDSTKQGQTFSLTAIKSWKSFHQLPPTFNVLELHAAHANYQAKIWLQANLPMTKIVPGGWKVDDDGTHEIVWSTLLPPIPESCLQLISCGCKRKCRTAACKCYKSEQVCSLPHVSATQTAASIFTQETLMNTWMMDHTAV